MPALRFRLVSASFEEYDEQQLRPHGIEEIFSLDELGNYRVGHDCIHPLIHRSVMVKGIYAHYESDSVWLLVEDNATGQLLEIDHEY